MTSNADSVVCRIDCTAELDPERYFAQGEARVVDSPLGPYREAEGKPLSRFGYRFDVFRVGVPHEVAIRYPDDKRRFTCIMDGVSYDSSTGAISGGEYPLSGSMQVIRLIFWPRWRECTLTFMTWSWDEPAAVASFEVREVGDLPGPAGPADPSGNLGREFGLCFEDPGGTGASLGACSREDWVSRLATYMRHTGQSVLVYPIDWYHGPQFPSQREPADVLDVVVGRNRRMYLRWTTQPPEWVAPLLEQFAEHGLRFIADVRYLRLGSLMERMNIDLDAIRKGGDTVNNMLWNDRVQSGTMDWTVVYNARNYPELVRRGLNFDVPWKGDFRFAYGEKCVADEGGGYPSTTCPPGPIFNPLHPAVQEAAVGYMREIGQRYGGYEAFDGVAVTMWAQTFLWYGSLCSGYDDYTVGLFQRETGREVPGDANAEDRFSQRYRYLTGAARETWINWRCQRTRDLLRRLRDALRESRRDLRLILAPNLRLLAWATLGTGAVRHQVYAGPPAITLLREAGLDLALLAEETGIEVDLTFEGGAGSRLAGSEPDASLDALVSEHDHDHLDPTGWDALRELPRSGCRIFDSWAEAWGKSSLFPCEVGDEEASGLAFIAGEPAEGICRLRCEHPADGFWYPDQWRISTPFAAGSHFLEPYAHALAESDALRLTRGGLYVDTAHAECQRSFALAFRALPRKKFDTVGDTTDPVAVRTSLHGGRRYVYAVNREPYPVDVRIVFAPAPREVTDLATGESLEVGAGLKLTLGPYELRSLGMQVQSVPTGFTATPPEDITESLQAQARRALTQLEAARNAGHDVAGIGRMEEEIRSALTVGRWAWLRHALAGYVVLKCAEVSDGLLQPE